MKWTLLLLMAATGAEAQTTRQHSTDSAAVHSLWTAYLASKGSRYASRSQQPWPEWSADEQKRWPSHQLAMFYLTDGMTTDTIEIDSVAGSGGREYRIRTRLRGRSEIVPTPSPDWYESMTLTVYAAHDGRQWRLANALPRHTRRWKRDTVGPITYVYPPDYPFDRARGRRAVAFTDSIAAAFGVAKLAPIEYYLVHTVDQVFAILGIQSSVKYGATGGLAQPVNRMLFSGIPSVGEEYRHELAHLMLAPLCCGRTDHIVGEGVATWLGGTTGMDLPTATRALARFLAERPAVTLDSIFGIGAIPQPERYAGAAILVAMVHDAGGVAAVKQLFTAGALRADWIRFVEQTLDKQWPAIGVEWRRRIADR